MDNGDKSWYCEICGAYHFYGIWKKCQYCGAVRGEEKEEMNKWEEMEALGRKGCASVWPKIVQLRAELKTYEDTHGYFEAMLIEAQRHLIKLPLDEKELPEKKKMEKMIRSIGRLTDNQREHLEKILEKTYSAGGEEVTK